MICADRRALVRRQPRTPDVADEDDARLVAVVPRFVLDRVVEHPGLADAPFARLAADAEAAAGRHDQRQVHDQAEVGDAGVRRDPRAAAGAPRTAPRASAAARAPAAGATALPWLPARGGSARRSADPSRRSETRSSAASDSARATGRAAGGRRSECTVRSRPGPRAGSARAPAASARSPLPGPRATGIRSRS